MAKSELHIELSRRALVWLATRATNSGIRGAEEIAIKEGYIADAVALSRLKLFYEEKLINGTPVIIPTPDYAFVFESKVSRSDFLATFKHDKHAGSRLSPAAHFHFIVTPPKLLSITEIPSFWGLLEQYGSGITLKKLPTFHNLPNNELYEIAYTLLRSTRWSKYTLQSLPITKSYVKDQQETDFNYSEEQLKRLHT